MAGAIVNKICDFLGMEVADNDEEDVEENKLPEYDDYSEEENVEDR